MERDIHQDITDIKKRLRLSMNGVVSAHQRKQGLDYKINFGVEIPRLKALAKEYEQNRDLAMELWGSSVRECKMLAIFLMPAGEFTADDATKWIATAPFTEIADHLAMNLLSHIPDSATNALLWTKSREGLYSYSGFLTLSHIFRRGGTLNEEQEKEFFMSIIDILGGENAATHPLTICAYTALTHYVETDPAKKVETLIRFAAGNAINDSSLLCKFIRNNRGATGDEL